MAGEKYLLAVCWGGWGGGGGGCKWCNVSRFQEKGKEANNGMERLKVHDDGDDDVV